MVQREIAVEEVVIDADFWRGRQVFLTGHTGFKGAWTALVLRHLGAKVTGFSLAPEVEDGIFCAAQVSQDLQHIIGDIRDRPTLTTAMAKAEPEIVLHMAAQSLVRLSYAEPIDTYSTNVLGTAHILEAVRQNRSARAVIVVTSDKCYENVGRAWSYRETDALGGHDPYSSSKACAEIVTEAYRRSFFHGRTSAHIASARAGNVIGGGDWARDRLVPDAMRAFATRQPLRIRNPEAVRPWQHVLDPVLGYLRLAECLVRQGRSFCGAWNFGPAPASEVSVSVIADHLVRHWQGDVHWQHDASDHPHEAAYLKLDCTKAASELQWRPLLSLDEALRATVEWYRALHDGMNMRKITLAQIEGVLAAERNTTALMTA
jgi:CDP-glucose 4,6-dehydratase